MNKETHPYFVPNDTAGSRKETAVLLVGTATEFEIHQREIASTRDGFRISENVFKALGWDDEDGDGQPDSVEGAQSDARTAQGQTVTGDADVLPYDQWERNDLLAEVSRRGLDTEDKKNATLAAALTADDEAVDADPDAGEPDADATL